MRKLIWQMSVSLDGYADHTEVIADTSPEAFDELFDFTTKQWDQMDFLLFGRVTYQLMEVWHKVPEDPNATKKMIEFANKFNAMPKIVFSRSLQKTVRENERLIRDNVIEEIIKLKQQSGKDLSIGGLNLPQEFIRHGLIDEYLLLLQPHILGKGKRLFDGLEEKIKLKLINTVTFQSGVVVLRYSSEK